MTSDVVGVNRGRYGHNIENKRPKRNATPSSEHIATKEGQCHSLVHTRACIIEKLFYMVCFGETLDSRKAKFRIKQAVSVNCFSIAEIRFSRQLF